MSVEGVARVDYCLCLRLLYVAFGLLLKETGYVELVLSF